MASENPTPDFAVHPALVLGVYGEELANGSRAAIFGSATLGLAEELVLRGARLVHVYDTDATRVAEATAQGHDRSIFFGTLPDSGDVGVRDGAFDFVIVPDLSFAPDKALLLSLVRRVLSPSGAVLIGSPNTDASAPLIAVDRVGAALGYYELYEAVAKHFSSVRMLGQAPFVGYAVAEFSVEDPEPTIDTSLAEAEGKEPDWFVVLASDRSIRLEPFALIEIPKGTRAVGDITESAHRVSRAPSPEAAPMSEGRGTVLVDILEAEREAALESLRQHEQIVKEERFRADHANSELGALREELELAREKSKAAEQRLEEEEARRSVLEVELERARAEVLRSRGEVERGRGEVERGRGEIERGRGEIERARAEIDVAQKSPELAELRERVKKVDEASDILVQEHEQDIARLESQLKERGKEVQELAAEVSRRDKLVRELVATNLPPANLPPTNLPPAEPPSAEAPPTNGQEGALADLSARLDRLAGEAATREADLQAARWKIAQLERERSEQR